jgi:urocanate hydratase
LSSGTDFQSALYSCYDALHAASAAFLVAQAKANPVADANKGALAGEFIVADSLSGTAAMLPLAALLGGACFLGVDNDPEAAKELLRHGQCDFVVNALDEALRILKNELRQKAAVAVCLTADVSTVFAEMVERGLAPELLLQSHPVPEGLRDSEQQLAATGTTIHPVPQAVDLVKLDASAPELTQWTLPQGTSAMLARVDAIALGLLPGEDRQRRRWLEAARYIPRQIPPARVCALTPAELELFVDAVAGRIMSGEISGPVVVTTPQRSITLGEARG